MANKPLVVVVGAGVQGLSSAHELLKAGWCTVSIVSRSPVAAPHGDATKPHCALWELPPYYPTPPRCPSPWSRGGLTGLWHWRQHQPPPD